MKIDLHTLTIKKAHDHLVNGDFTVVELVQEYLNIINSKNKEVNAYLEIFKDVLEEAKNRDIEIKKLIKEKGKDNVPLLMGIPCAIKDNILIKGRIASASSKILENYHATYDATVIRKLKEQGVIFIGRTNMDEFAMGGSTENSAFGVTKNPQDTSRVAGGSSGGSAAVVAMDGALFALGSDTGGSIRQPASFCGIVGLKPTYGAVSRYGVMAMGSSLDQIGPMTKTVEDAKIVFDVIRGKDGNDGTSHDLSISNTKIKDKPTIGIPRKFVSGDGIDPAVKKAFDETISNLESKGYKVKDIELPNISYSLMVYYIVMPAEVSANMARYDGMRFGLHKSGKDGIEDYFLSRREGLGSEVIRRILLGTYVLSSGYYDAYYNRANAVINMITEDFKKAFKDVDVIAMPTAPSPAFKIGSKVNDPVSMYLEDIFTVTANLTGMPAISVPMKTDGLPVGIQFTSTHGGEQILFNIGKEVEGIECIK
jgi:aspartyl-tRNA(Asn)/glutamyl-tRNA(Gln) amidotransferase subunit A